MSGRRGSGPAINNSGFEVRSWGEFGDGQSFSVPEQQVFNERVTTNLIYYQANYTIIFILLMLFVCVAKPWFLICIVLVVAVGVWIYSMQQQAQDPNSFNVHWGLLLFLGGLFLFQTGGESFLVALLLSLSSNLIIIEFACSVSVD
eukprot:TRINITY_DN4088_c0_g1_i2.p1 TRINITY_DN4088_c0_g1~~TRINITY_DN4088_c0_g1_i2.p1  ORF type:complete len:158 (+),score=28.68 TRINITY_DN4088_c0_g1_i2:37-474(+)